jgi:hypothetical protein
MQRLGVQPQRFIRARSFPAWIGIISITQD